MSASDVAPTMERLHEEVRHCTRCDLHLGATQGVPGEGPFDADILLVGEGPGFHEDQQGRPFVGPAGMFLEELLAMAGLNRSDVYITNVIKHRPPSNRDPLPDELLACRPYLDRQIELMQPRLVVTLGRFSLGTFFPGSVMSKVHGQVREHDGRYFFHMYHPAAALHQDRLRQTLIEDMKKLTDFIRGPLSEKPAQSEDDEPLEQLSLF